MGQNNNTVTGCYFLQTTGVNESLQGIGNDEAIGATAESVDNLGELCQKFTSDPWTINTTLGRPVLTSNPEDDGSEQHPYRISTADQLENFRDLVNGEGGNPNAHAKLMNNIDLKGSDVNQWTPIGTSSNKYTGTFDGQNFKISGLYIEENNGYYQGLFGYVSGTVKDLTVSGSVSGYYYVGGVVGFNYGSITDCAFTGSVKGGSYVGGVVGWNSSGANVENCYNTGSVNVSGNSSVVGGVVGWNISSGSVKNCYNTGEVSGKISVGGVGGITAAAVSQAAIS